MKKLLRPLALSAALGVGGIFGTNWLTADEKKPVEPPPVKPLPADPLKPLPGGLGDPIKPGLPGKVPGGTETPMGDSKPNNDVAPVKVGETMAKTDFAVKPKDLSAAVKNGLAYLVKNQQE